MNLICDNQEVGFNFVVICKLWVGGCGLKEFTN